MASGFGGGIGGSGGTCGALVGAVMAVGVARGRDSADDDGTELRTISRRIFSAFEQEMGATACRELTGLDLRTTEGGRELRAAGVGERVCQPAIALAERLALGELLPE